MGQLGPVCTASTRLPGRPEAPAASERPFWRLPLQRRLWVLREGGVLSSAVRAPRAPRGNPPRRPPLLPRPPHLRTQDAPGPALQLTQAPCPAAECLGGLCCPWRLDTPLHVAVPSGPGSCCCPQRSCWQRSGKEVGGGEVATQPPEVQAPHGPRGCFCSRGPPGAPSPALPANPCACSVAVLTPRIWGGGGPSVAGLLLWPHTPSGRRQEDAGAHRAAARCGAFCCRGGVWTAGVGAGGLYQRGAGLLQWEGERSAALMEGGHDMNLSPEQGVRLEAGRGWGPGRDLGGHRAWAGARWMVML